MSTYIPRPRWETEFKKWWGCPHTNNLDADEWSAYRAGFQRATRLAERIAQKYGADESLRRIRVLGAIDRATVAAIRSRGEAAP